MVNFKTNNYLFDEVRPSRKDLHDFLQLGLLEPEHPALVFLEEILPDLNAAESIRGSYALFKVVEQDIRKGTIGLEGPVSFSHSMFSTGIEDKNLSPDKGGLSTSTLPLKREVLEVGCQVCGYLKDSEYAILFLCTAGAEFTSLADHFTSNGDLLEAYLVDAIGSLTVENAMDKIQIGIEAEWEDPGFKITNRYSPGYCNWHLNEQKKLFYLLDGHDSGVELSESCLMLPRKSVSGIIGLGRKARKRDYGCETCHNTTCIYRKILARTNEV